MSAAEHDLSDYTRCNCCKHVVATYANPVVSARWLLQSVATIVIHHILAIAIIIGQPVTTTPFARAVAVHAWTATTRAVIGARRRTVVVVMLASGVALRTTVLRLILILITVAVTLHASLRLAARTLLRAAMIVVTTGVALRKCRRCQTQT